MIQISQEGNIVILRRWRSSTTMLAYNILFFSIAALQCKILLCYGFSSTDIISNKRQLSTLLPLYSEVQTPSYTLGIGFSDDDDDLDNLPTLNGPLEKCILQQFTLNDHKPLGCSVEESLAVEDETANYVFVSEVKKGGNAAKAGLKEGDVIVQLSGTFDELVDVTGLGIDRIQSLVGGRQEDRKVRVSIVLLNLPLLITFAYHNMY